MNYLPGSKFSLGLLIAFVAGWFVSRAAAGLRTSQGTRHVLWIVLLLAVLVFVGWGLWRVPFLLLEPYKTGLTTLEYVRQVNAYRATLAQSAGGLFVLIGLYFGWKRLTATERTIDISQEGQVTERFSRAVEHIGSDKLEVRLGGIYALERIARDSLRDRWTIVEFLSAYVREKATWPPPATPPPATPSPVTPSPPRPTLDLQAGLTVIGRLPRTGELGEAQAPDLSGTDLRGYDLRAAHLENALLYGTHMEWCHLENSYLQRVRLVGSYLDHAWLENAHLEDADLKYASLKSAILQNANLNNANFNRAHLDNANLLSANLTHATFVGAYAEETDFTSAILKDADLRNAHLRGATLSEADLSGADLTWADLTGVVGLTRMQLHAARGTPNALPPYLPP